MPKLYDLTNGDENAAGIPELVELFIALASQHGYKLFLVALEKQDSIYPVILLEGMPPEDFADFLQYVKECYFQTQRVNGTIQ